MTRRLVVPLACLLTLGACDKIQMAAFGTSAVLPAEQLTKVQRGCQLVAPALAVAVVPTMPATVKDTAEYAKAYCDQLLAGAVPATTDANTPAWFDRTLQFLSITAKAAGVILPLVL